MASPGVAGVELASAAVRVVVGRRESGRFRVTGVGHAALPATAREHGLAILRPHADEEAVRALATAIVGLKSTLH